MSLFNRNKQSASDSSDGLLAKTALANIHDGVVITDRSGVIRYANPAAISVLDGGQADHIIGFDYGLLIRIESKEGRELSEAENPFIQAMKTGQNLERYQASLVLGDATKRIPVAISVIISSEDASRIITFRDITKELAEEGEQTEFISTASHEMRTPVASIEGYLSLALNPQTATIDERARGYLDSAHTAAKHLGQLFQNLLDITKLDDGHIKPHFEPVEMVSTVRQIAEEYTGMAEEAKLRFQFGSKSSGLGGSRRVEQAVYGYVDINFLREILDNLIGNAIKYTPEGGSIYVNALGDGDRVLINVTDTGIGISADDLQHVFQKFYRADNSDTRTIGGTGLGLYLVKQRVEAMGGRVWAESAFGEGSTFYVSLPRLSNDEYEKRMIAVRNAEMMRQAQISAALSSVPAGASPASASASPVPPVQTPAPVAPQPVAPAAPIMPQPAPAQPMPAPITQPAPMPQPMPVQPTQYIQPVVASAQPMMQSAAPIQQVPFPQMVPVSQMPPAPPTALPPQPTNNPSIINNNQNGGIR